MKKNFQIFSSFIIFYKFFLLIRITYEDNYIKEIITIDEEQNPYIALSNDKTINFLISLSSPIIFFNEKANINNDEERDLYTNIYNETFEYVIRKKNFLLNNRLSGREFNYGSLISSNIPINYGLYGLGRSKKGITNPNINSFLKQLLKKQLISREIIYIQPYYKNNSLLKDSSIFIGNNDEKIFKKKSDLPYCDIIKDSLDYYDCAISNIIIESNNTSNNIYKYKKKKDTNPIIARFEELNLQPTIFPKSLYESFKDYFKKICECKNKKFEIICDSKIIENLNISIVINDYKFRLNKECLWKNNKLSFSSNIDDRAIIFTSAFTGYYHRIYDNFNKKIFFYDENNNIISLNAKEKTKQTIYWIILLSISALLLIASIVIIILAFQIKKKNLLEEVKSISFVKKRDEENEENEENEDGDDILE